MRAITAGRFFTNVLAAIADAWFDAAPILFLTSSPPLREVVTNPPQGGFDQVAMAAPAPEAVAQLLDLLAVFVERVGVPVVASAKGVGALPAGYRWNAGPGSVLAQTANRVQQPPDLVVQLGARGDVSG